MVSFIGPKRRALFAYTRNKWEDLRASEEQVSREEAEVEKSFTEKLKGVASRLARSVLNDLVTAYFVMRDKDTPLIAKAGLSAALLYFISPFDAISDFVPGGLADDTAILAAALTHFSSHIKEHHRQQADEFLDRVLKS